MSEYKDLSRWDAARHALAEAVTIDEVKDIRDKAEAMRVYLKQAGESLEMQNNVADIKLRAERKAGLLLKDLPKNAGGQAEHTDYVATGDTMSPVEKLEDIGISKKQSSRLQLMAELDADAFDAHIAKTKEGGQELTTVSVLRKATEQRREAKREENRQQVASTAPIGTHVQGRTYTTIVIDPPWDWGDEGDKDQLGRARPTYDTMTIDQIAALPVAALADTNAHLYLWITNRSLPKGFHLLETWGFRYITCLTWCKPSIGMGNYYRGSTEQILFGVRGQLPLLRQDQGTWFQADRARPHSTKPLAFYSMIETCSPSPWVELFARSARPGWATWGAEA